MKYEQIQILINKINAQVNDLKNADKISALDIDMVKKNIINLYEEFLIKEINEIKEENQIEEEVEKIKEEISSESITFVESEKQENLSEPINSVEEMIFVPVQVAAEEKTPSSHTMTQLNSLFDDEFDSELPTFSRQPKQEQANDVNSRYSEIQTITVADTIVAKVKKPLQSCITIGDKFSLIKDLFANNVAEYTDTIMALNEAETLKDCLQILAPVQEKYKWNDDSYAALTLLNLLKRRFA